MQKRKGEAVLILFCVMKSLLHAIPVMQDCFLSSREAASLIAKVSAASAWTSLVIPNKMRVAYLGFFCFVGQKDAILTLHVPCRYGKVSIINFPECWRNGGLCRTRAGSLWGCNVTICRWSIFFFFFFFKAANGERLIPLCQNRAEILFLVSCCCYHPFLSWWEQFTVFYWAGPAQYWSTTPSVTPQ